MFFLVFSSCQKRKCKEAQQKELTALTLQYQKEISNTNLTAQQIEALTLRFQEDQKKILEECN